MGARETMTDLGMKGLNLGHKALLTISGGRIGSTAGGMPAVELHTVGRKSGQRRTSMLTAPIYEEDRVVLVASKGGDDRNPAWYLNLTANPEVELTHRGETRPMTARTATPEERAEIWPAITSMYKGYAGYQTKTEREIPVVICEPR